MDDLLSYYERELAFRVEEAFEKVCGYVVQVAALGAQVDVDGIEAFKGLGVAFKWMEYPRCFVREVRV